MNKNSSCQKHLSNKFFHKETLGISKEKIMEKIYRDVPRKRRRLSWTGLETKPFLARNL